MLKIHNISELLTPYYIEKISKTKERFGSKNDGGYV
jgi:hypothetical protein